MVIERWIAVIYWFLWVRTIPEAGSVEVGIRRPNLLKVAIIVLIVVHLESRRVVQPVHRCIR